MTTFKVEYEETYISGGEALSEGPYSDREDTYYEFEATRALKHTANPYHEVFEVDTNTKPQALFVVVVRYRSGDSFGKSYGHGSVQGLYLKRAEAIERKKAIENGAGGLKGYTPWDGYFEKLTDIEIYPIPVEEL